MRYLNVSTAALLITFLACALPAEASTGFESWWREKSGEIDGRWAAAALREAGVPATTANDGASGEERGYRSRTAPVPAKRGSRNNPGAGPAWSGSITPNFSTHTRGDNLWRSTRERSGPSRGIHRLSSPSEATRASSAARRLPFNNSSKYRRSVGTGRAAAWRRHPKIGQRLRRSGSATRRRGSASSYTRGSTRMRRSARSAR